MLVADRWHLLANLFEAVERFINTRQTNINKSMWATLQIKDKPTTTQQLTDNQLLTFITLETEMFQPCQVLNLIALPKPIRLPKGKLLQAEGHGRWEIARHLGIVASAVRQKHLQALPATEYIRCANDHEAVKPVSV